MEKKKEETDRQQKIRKTMRKLLLKAKPVENITFKRKALKGLRNEKNIIIRPADKGRWIVVVDKL